MQNWPRSKAATLTAALFCLAAVPGCRSQPPRDDAQDNAGTEVAPSPRLSVAEPPLSRARLLISVAQAASAHVTGADDREAQRKLDGKQFEVRIRFGCEGQGPGRGEHGWSVDPDGRTLRLRAVPTLSLEDELVRRLAGDNIEAVEGFWLSRPWLLNAACPADQANEEAGAPADTEAAVDGRDQTGPLPAATPSAVQRIGIARFFTPQDSRTGRRIDRPFQAVRQLKEGEQVGDNGFNLVLAGRLRGRSDGRVIRCTGNGHDRPPDCIVSADVDRVWIEQPDSKEVMAEWSA